MKKPNAISNASFNEKEIAQEKNSEVEGSDTSVIDLENWMRNLPHSLTRIPIIYLSIPGSHNSFSYSLSPTSEVSPDSPQVVQRIGKWFKPITNRIIYNWSMGQKENVTTQLLNGIRYFDIRLVSKNGETYISHGLFGGNIMTFLQEMASFLSIHPQEVVILDFQHFYKFTIENHEFMSNLLQDIFGCKICRRQLLMRDITLNYLWQNGYQVIIIYRHSQVNYNNLCWPSGSWVTPWPNKIKTCDLLEYLDKGIASRRDGIGYVSQGILTPTPKYVICHIASSLQHLALQNNKKLSTWLDTKANGRDGVNVVICDFVESYAFCEKVIRLNYKNLKSEKE